MKKLLNLSLWFFAAWMCSGISMTPLAAQSPENIRIVSAKTNISNSYIHGETDDQALAQKIDDAIQNFVFYGIYDFITAEVSDGSVLLKGWTHEKWIGDLLIKKLSGIEGVNHIDNRIQQAFGSEDLARRAARAIYSDAMFEKYSFGSNPPIHIIVNNNTIILAGALTGEAERNRAAYLVDLKTNALAVNNLLNVQ